MPKLTAEQKEVESFIRAASQQAQDWQKAITQDEDLEKWVADGHWTYLRSKVLDGLELAAFRTVKNPAFDPTNFSQVAQFKALCQTIDLIEQSINQRVAMVQDARTKLRELEMSTPKDENG
jgi:hypothetical protein